MLVLLGLELAIGNFALLPPAVAANQITAAPMFREWFWVYAFNLGERCARVALLSGPRHLPCKQQRPADLLRVTAHRKTCAYMAAGGAGWATAPGQGSALASLKCNVP